MTGKQTDAMARGFCKHTGSDKGTQRSDSGPKEDKYCMSRSLHVPHADLTRGGWRPEVQPPRMPRTPPTATPPCLWLCTHYTRIIHALCAVSQLGGGGTVILYHPLSVHHHCYLHREHIVGSVLWSHHVMVVMKAVMNIITQITPITGHWTERDWKYFIEVICDDRYGCERCQGHVASKQQRWRKKKEIQRKCYKYRAGHKQEMMDSSGVSRRLALDLRLADRVAQHAACAVRVHLVPA